MVKHIGILGGTFDPPHNGHLLIANEVLHHLKLDEIWFLPNNIPPHKEDEQVSNSVDRLNMLEIAISNHPNFKMKTLELEREGPSYTYETIKLLKNQYKDFQFYFIIGADMVEYLPHWHKIEELLELITFVGVKRPHFTFSSPYHIIAIDIPQFDVSSSMLRDRISRRESTMYLLPDKVRQYIEEKNLYGSK